MRRDVPAPPRPVPVPAPVPPPVPLPVPVPGPRPALMIVGDSHTAALHAAARAKGIDARLLYLSGNFWHEGRIRFHPEVGLSAAYRPALQRQIRAAAAAAGGSVLPRDVPVIAAFGYHLGRLAPLFARHGHTPDPADGAEGAQFVSRALFEAWLHHHRGALRRVLRQAARVCPLVVVAPPVVRDDPVAQAIAAAITDGLLADGLCVFDPRREPGFGPDPLAAHLRSADGVHATPEYAARVLDRLLAKGWIRLPA